MATISSPGIGSNLDVNGIVTKLMQVESQPLTTLNQKQASFQARLSAFGSLSGALSGFQSALAALATPARFKGTTASVSDSSIASAQSTDKATPGSYSINVSQLASSQTLTSRGMTSMTSSIGSGASTKISFSFGKIGFAGSGSTLDSAVAASGIAAGSLSINGSTIATSTATNSAKALASQINLLKGTTGVTATANAADSGVLNFSDVSTDIGDAWSLDIAGISIASLTDAGSFTAAQLDSTLADPAMRDALAAKGIAVSGTAAGGDLRLRAADGSNIALTQTLTNASNNASGGIAGLTSGVTKTWMGSVSLASDQAITVGGSNPSAAGLSGFKATLDNGSYTNGFFTQDATQATGTVTIDGNNSLQGIRDAINKANVGVTASIVSDGSDTPYRLVLTSNKTGAKSSMKISVDGDATVAALLSQDPAGTQNLTQTTQAQDTKLTVNGIAISSGSTTVTEAIQGTTLSVNKTGSTTLNVQRDTASVSNAVNSLVNAYNSLQKTIVSLSGYDANTKAAGPLNGDATVRTIQSQLRMALTTPLKGTGALNNLTQLGITFAKDGTLALESSKLQSAINDNYGDIAALFSEIATPSDSLVAFTGSTSATKPGIYALSVTRLATQGSASGAVKLDSGPTVIGANAAISVTLDGTTARVPLTAGTYSATELAAMLESAINGVSAFSTNKSTVDVSVDSNGKLKLVSARYGTASNVKVAQEGSDATATQLMGATPDTPVDGLDVQGSIGGLEATGSGQKLTAKDGSPAAGLALTITGGALGDRGTVSMARGYGASISALLDNFLGTKGTLAANTDGINASIKQINDKRTRLNNELDVKQKRYLAQFTALDVAISKMTATQTYLTQQLAQFTANSKNNN